MSEVWKDIKGYDGIYQVSNLGRVRSVERRARNNRNGATRLIEGQIIIPTDNGNGYKIVCLHTNRTRKNKYVHRLVAEHFIDNPHNKKYINHLDYDKSNNQATNLEWCTQKENVDYSVDHMRKPRKKCQNTTTGYKYIGKRNNHYRVCIPNKRIDRSFATIEEAIEFRNNQIGEVV